MNKNKILSSLILGSILLCALVLPLIGYGTAHAANGDAYFWAPVAGNGTGNWSDVAHWSSSNDGTGGDFATPPNSTNNVTFGSAAFTGPGQVVTVDATASCASMDWTGATNTPTLAGTARLDPYGSVTFISGMSLTLSNEIACKGTGTHTITTAGLTIASHLGFYGAGTYTFQDNVTFAAEKQIYHDAGTLNTNGKTITIPSSGRGLVIEGAGVKVLTLGSSTINCGNWNYSGSNLTISANTATIKVTGTGAFAGGNITTYNNIELNGTAHTVSGAFTCAKLSRNGTNTKTDSVTFTSGTTVTCTDLDLKGNAAHVYDRLLVQSSTLGSPATITVTNKPVISQTDLMDITLTNAQDYSAQTDVGDCGGNTGFTFPAGVAQTSSKASTWSDPTMWTSRVPLPQDDVTCSHSVTVDMPRIGKSITFTGTPTVTNASSTDFFGSLTLNTGTTYVNGGYLQTFRGRGNYSLTSSGNSLYTIFLFAPGGSLTLQDSTIVTRSGSTATTAAIEVSNGTFNTNGRSLTVAGYIRSQGTETRGIILGSSTITLTQFATSTRKWTMEPTGLTFSAGTSTIVMTSSDVNAQTFAGGGLTYSSVLVQGAGNYNLTVTGNNTYNIFRVDASQANKTITGTGTTQTVNDFKRGSAMTTNIVTLVGGTWTKTDAVPISLDYMSISNSTANPDNTWYAGTHSTNGGGNTRWYFTDPALSVTTDATTGVTMNKDGVTGGVFNGTIAEIDGTPTISTWFEYGLTVLYGDNTTPITVYASGPYTGTIPTILTPGQTYHCRAAISNAAGTFTGADQTFVFTLPTSASNAPTNVGFGPGTHATLNGSVSNMGVASDTYGFFEWGYTALYGNTLSNHTIAGVSSVSDTISGFNPNLVVHYRFNTQNGGVIVSGADQTFSVIGTAPSDNSLVVYNFTNNTVTLLFVAFILFLLFVLALRENLSPVMTLILMAVAIMVGMAFLAGLQTLINGMWGG